jgi:hypothetical protein
VTSSHFKSDFLSQNLSGNNPTKSSITPSAALSLYLITGVNGYVTHIYALNKSARLSQIDEILVHKYRNAISDGTRTMAIYTSGENFLKCF